MTVDELLVNGIQYVRQSRMCNKANCRCHNGGPAHGPYWYSRPQTGGPLKYVGRTLPAAITKRVDRIHAQAKAIDAKIKSLERQRDRLQSQVDALDVTADALRALVTGFHADPADLKGTGFAALAKGIPQ